MVGRKPLWLRFPHRRAVPAALAAGAALLIGACSGDGIPEHAVMLPPQDLPDTVLGSATWADGGRKDIHRVVCELDQPFYRMKAEGADFELEVGFWGSDVETLDDIDFEQADSVELRAVDDELYYYRYSILRILPEMGPVAGGPEAAAGKTYLRSTSEQAIAEHGAGIDIDFEFSCSASPARPGAES